MPAVERWVGIGGYFWDQEDASRIPGAQIQEETVVCAANTRCYTRWHAASSTTHGHGWDRRAPTTGGGA
jgi:hypothetical protein